MKVLITTVPFGLKDRYPLDLLEERGVTYTINPLGKKLTEDELIGLVGDCEVIVAGTEPITKRVLEAATNLKLISRVGIGLDSVDLLTAKERNIAVSYTPDAPAPAVAELTIGLMYSLQRHIHESNVQLHNKKWHRYFGKRLTNCTIGLIGMGRIGSMVQQHLQALGCTNILCNDINPQVINDSQNNTGRRFVEKTEIFSESDIISLHVPLTSVTKNMVTTKELGSMREGSFIINSSRGGVINETDLFGALKKRDIEGAAIDVFEDEPYSGNLSELDNCLLTAHMGSMSVDCRTRMEIEATEEAVRFLSNGIQESAVPDEEYEVQRQGL